MAIQIKSDGTFAIEYIGPYGGLNVQAPETNIPDTDSPSFNNFLLRNAELRSRPQFVQEFAGPGGSFLGLLGLTSFQDINGIFHTVLWNNGTTLFQYNPNINPPWSGLAASQSPMGPNPIAYRTFANAVYYTNVSQFFGTTRPFMAYWDGIAANAFFSQTFADASTANSMAAISKTNSPTVGGSLPGGPTVVGPLEIGAQYISELNNQLILANVSVRDVNNGAIYNFPNLIWWSANGLPLIYDPTTNTSAGFNPFLDVSDQITGLSMQGVAGFIFRTYGITQMVSTGSAITPWEFDHMWASERGIGNVYPWSIAQYGPTTCFIAEDNIYSISIASATPIGGKARDAIMADLQTAGTTPVATLVPYFEAGEFVYLTYQIAIFMPGGFTRFYLYSFEEKNWSPWDVTSAAGTCSCPPNSV